MNPQDIPTSILRSFVLKIVLRLLEEHGQDDDVWFENEFGETEDWVGELVFTGGIFNYDLDFLDEEMEEIYINEFKPLLNRLNVDEVDYYIYMKQKIEDKYGMFCAYQQRDKTKYNIMSLMCKEVINSYQEDLQITNCTANLYDWVSFQAIWRGYNERWKNPFFTFKN